jgi:outer membrane protein OmpA-like peptidoglycan-associated protein
MDSESDNTSAALGEESHWIPLSDLMTGLMVIFLLIAVSYMMQVEADAARIKQIAVAYSDIKDALFEDLQKEFKADLPKWKAQLLKNDLAIRFSEPEVLFDTGSSQLKPEFQAILQDFFPRYVHILTLPKYRAAISEVRIEGHTSSDWKNGAASADEAYFLNMELSQARTRSTLAYVLNLAAVRDQVAWLRKFVTANGLSSSRLILDDKAAEDVARSRRVEFRVRTDAETRIARILEVSK